MYVYSGECRLCDVGPPIGANDCTGKPLFTGDIVLTYTEENNLGATYVAGLTAVVSDQYQSFSDGTFTERKNPEFYVMGIKNVPLHDSGEWRVQRVKSYIDAIVGEHWREYGFSFKEN